MFEDNVLLELGFGVFDLMADAARVAFFFSRFDLAALCLMLMALLIMLL